MTSEQRASRWIERRKLRVEYETDTSRQDSMARAVIRGPWDHCEPYALVELVKRLRGPRKDPTLKWIWKGNVAECDGHPNVIVNAWRMRKHCRFVVDINDDATVSSGIRRTLAGARRAAMLAAEMAMRLRGLI